MNKIPPKLKTGTLGELLVQLRLLEYRVQAAPPLKDTGNDLIAIRKKVFRAIQVKTSEGERYSIRKLPRFFHILAVVQLIFDNTKLQLDKSEIYLIKKNRIKNAPRSFEKLSDFRLSHELVDELFTNSRTR